MIAPEAIHRGVTNHGHFLSPYYLFDLLARQHADELDPAGREANRRLLRRPFRAAAARFEGGSSAGEAWQAWHRELFEALGFALEPLAQPVAAGRHGAAPISRAAYPPAAADAATPEFAADRVPLVLVDHHGFGVDLDRTPYPDAGRPTRSGRDAITQEPIGRAVEFTLDAGATRWALVAAGERLRLYRKGGSVARQYLEVNFAALCDGDRDDEWAAFWGLFRYAAFVPDPATGKCLLDRVLDESQRHAARIADDLRENVVSAVEALIQGVLDEPANRSLVGAPPQERVVQQLFVESLYFLYRLLFVLYAESRDLLPVGESPVYRDAYSLEHLRDLAEQPLPAEDGDKRYYAETLRTLFQMLRAGFPPAAPTGMTHDESRVMRHASPFTIPPFNGQLFDARRTELLDRCHIPDRSLRVVIRELSLSRPRQRGQLRQRYSYADLGVDQLGSIYEGLLVYEPALAEEDLVLARLKGEERLVTRAQAAAHDLPLAPGADGEPFVRQRGAFLLRLWGGRRKGSGSYYTLQELTAFLVRAALAPLVEPIIAGCAARDERGRPLRSPEEILALRLCDTAMGSGVFLVQTCRYLAEAYGRARIAAGEDEDGRLSAEEFARYKRRVAERCLYGVDLNPLAVELAKVSLWLETLAVDRPLTFLDAHLRCGNSLVGAPLRDEHGRSDTARLVVLPDAVFKTTSKEATPAQKARLRALAQRNKEEVKRVQAHRAGQTLFDNILDWNVAAREAIERALADTLRQRLELETSDEKLPLVDAVALVHRKEQLLATLEHAAASRYRRAKAVCDLWCAVWFWPEPGTLLATAAGDVVAPEPPTTQVFLELAGALLDVEPSSLDPADEAAYLAVAAHVAHEQRFFHWELEFPELWRTTPKPQDPKTSSPSGGFHAITGNPPWETIKPNSQEFWSNYDPLFRELNKQAALTFAAAQRADPAVDQAWRAYERGLAQAAHFCKASGHYTVQGRGDLNTYKLFLERNLALLRDDGGLGQVLPSGVYTDLGSKELRERIFASCRVGSLLAFTNERFIFPAVHHAFRFVLLSLRKGGETAILQALFRLNVRNAVAAEELGPLFANLEPATLALRVADIRRFSPDSLSIMEFKSQREVDITAAIYASHPLLGDELKGAWNARFASEFHMTGDSGLFSEESTGWPLVEGRMVHAYDHRAAYWVSGRGRTAVWQYHNGPERFGSDYPWRPQWSLPASAVGVRANDLYGGLAWRIGICDVTASGNERSILAALLAKETGAGHSVNTCQIVEHEPSGAILVLLAVLNSFVFDFIMRFRLVLHASPFLLAQAPVPRVTREHPAYATLLLPALRLSCTTPEYAPFWDETVNRERLPLPVPWRQSLAALDAGERARLRAEIDAAVADLYGLATADFAYILTTFPLLDRDQPALPGEAHSTITRDQALLALCDLRGEPPPADVVAFFAAAGADIAATTGPVRELRARVAAAQGLGAVGYVVSGRGGGAGMSEEIVETDDRSGQEDE